MSARSSDRSMGSLKSEGRITYSSSKTLFSKTHQLAVQLLVSLLLLPPNTSILLVTTLLNQFRLPRGWEKLNKEFHLKNPPFNPRTILITGINTVRGLKLARQFHYGGHRVVGADVDLSAVRSGGSMSNAISVYYAVSKSHYVSNLIDIIHREKVDLWIPYSDYVSPFEDGMVKSTIESRTACRCLHLNANYVSLFDQNDSFLKHIAERGLPAILKQTVQSRDSIHRILNRSPNKAYDIYPFSGGTVQNAVSLPKNTLSQTYSDLSILEITKDNPWILRQRARLGQYWADLVLVQGQVKAMKIRPLLLQSSGIGDSRVESGLHTTISQVMHSFAEKVGPRISGHLSVEVMVDEEVTANSICHTVYICDCRQGSSAVSELLDDLPPKLYISYLEILASEENGAPVTPKLQLPNKSRHSGAAFIYTAVSNRLQILSSRMIDVAEGLQGQISQGASGLKFFDARFSIRDPIPWWWHSHISQPLNGLISIFDGEIETSTAR